MTNCIKKSYMMKNWRRDNSLPINIKNGVKLKKISREEFKFSDTSKLIMFGKVGEKGILEKVLNY